MKLDWLKSDVQYLKNHYLNAIHDLKKPHESVSLRKFKNFWLTAILDYLLMVRSFVSMQDMLYRRLVLMIFNLA